MNIRLQLATPDEFVRHHFTCAGKLELLRHMKGEIGMLGLLLMTRGFEATDPRDKMFALVGLGEDVDDDFVDYEKSIEEVLKDLSRRFLEARVPSVTSSLDIWSCIDGAQDSRESETPSWIMDWRRLMESSTRGLIYRRRQRRPRTSFQGIWRISLRPMPRIVLSNGQGWLLNVANRS